MTTTTALLVALSRHQGAENGISAEALAAQIGCTPRDLRSLVSALREDAIAVCAHPRHGYYMPVTAEELFASTDFLRRRALKSLRLMARMQRVALPVLLGQLALSQV